MRIATAALVWMGWIRSVALAEDARVVDRGIYAELSAQVEAGLSAVPPRAGDTLRIDTARGLATLYLGDDPQKVYRYPLDDAARRELATLATSPREVHRAPSADEDHDGDGIVDRLDILRGAKKLLINRAAYHERYQTLPYPNGDVSRTEGVCTDTIIRSLRNAGLDLQRLVHEDILAARGSYPMVEKVDANINHRRVKTMRSWFLRHFRALPVDADFQPGDVVFFDTFPNKSGAEHVGLVSDRAGSDGKLLIVNNWTDGAVDAEMPLLSFVPVTDHFRAGRPRRDAVPR